MGSGKGGLRADRRSSREPATPTASQNESRLTTPSALSAGGPATADLAPHQSALKLNESPGGCFVKMRFKKRSNIIQFTFRGIDRHSRLANETIPFLLEALCKLPVARSIDGVITTNVEWREDDQKVRDRDPDLVCRVIDHLRNSGLSDDEIVRLMNGTSFSEFLSGGDLTFEGDETVNLHYTGDSDMTLTIVQQAVQDLWACGAYELASRVLDWKAVQALDPEELWHRGDNPLRGIGMTLKLELNAAGRDTDNVDEEKIDKEFRPLKRLFRIALLTRQGTARESLLRQPDFKSLVESSSEPLVISEDSSDPVVISEDV